MLGHTQIFPMLKGKVFRNVTELPELSNCIRIDARVNECGAICYDLQDSINFNTLIVASLETADISKVITDFLVIDTNSFQRANFIQIGSYETKSGKRTHAFIIAIEQERQDYKPDSNGIYPARPSKSIRIFKAWTFDCVNSKLRKISVKNLYRINEGYYRG